MVLDAAGPFILYHSPTEVRNDTFEYIEVTFNTAVDAATFTTGDVAIAGPSGAVEATGIEQLAPDIFRIGFDPLTMPGTYQALIGPNIADLDGNLMDQNQDGIAGQIGDDVYVGEFRYTFAATVTTTADAGPGSLRQAILDANAADKPMTIAFAIPETEPGYVTGTHVTEEGDQQYSVFVIQPATPLPALSNSNFGITLDGRTQVEQTGETNPFGPMIVLDGSSLTGGDGLHIHSDDNVVIGLNVQGFPWNGIRISGANNRIAGNLIGTDATGTARRANTQGVLIVGPSNLVGGTEPEDRNVISGNLQNGIQISGQSAVDNVLAGNFIGTDATGMVGLGNAGQGVRINNASKNLVGGTNTGARNVIADNSGHGIALLGTGATGNLVQGNFIGVGIDGTTPLGNSPSAILIEDSPENTIGGTAPDARNIIAANRSIGVRISGALATGNRIIGNYIGTDVTGTTARGNSADGILVHNNSRDTIIRDNLISANQRHGIFLLGSGTSGTLVQGNFLGTDATGMLGMGNAHQGVRIDNAPGNQIGGTTPGAGNVIADNRSIGIALLEPGAADNLVQGNFIGVAADGETALGNRGQGVFIRNASANAIGSASPDAGNVISGNQTHGVWLTGAGSTGNLVQGNFIGTDASGTVALANGQSGILIENGAMANTIGGAMMGERNVISGNTVHGVMLQGSGTSANVVAGNYIGTNLAGTAPLGNSQQGVRIQNAAGNLIGGTPPGARNVIVDNGNVGIGVFGADSTGNLVQGNFIGVAADGMTPLGNTGQGGVLIQNASGNTIGGTAPGAANVISGNTGNLAAGIQLQGTLARDNLVQGNLIGTDHTGTQPVPNQFDGIRIDNAPQNTVGGTQPGAGNVISGNARFGVLVVHAGATGNAVQGNAIGMNAAGDALGNGSDGVRITNGAPHNIVGVDQSNNAAAGNQIAFNGGTGVAVNMDNGTIGNTIRGNAIHSNTGLGIDLDSDGVTANDPLDADTGPNNLQNFPMILEASAGATTIVRGSLHSVPNQVFVLDFYANSESDPSGHGQGTCWLGWTSVTTDALGDAEFYRELSATACGEFITATATDAEGNTSEFSSVLQETELVPLGAALSGAVLFGGPGHQGIASGSRGPGVAVGQGAVYVSATSGAGFDAEWLVAQFPLGFDHDSAPDWTTSWPGLWGPDVTSGIAVGANGVYVAGTSYGRTVDSEGGKEAKGTVALFPFDGTSGTGFGGAIWDRQVPPPPGGFSYEGYEFLHDIVLTVEQGQTFAYVTGRSQSGFFNGGRLIVSKVDSNGTVIWTHNDAAEQVGNSYSSGHALIAHDGAIYIAGTNWDDGFSRPYLRAYNASGNLLWTLRDTTVLGEYHGIVADDNGIFAVGTATTAAGDRDNLVARYDFSGNLVWSRQSGGTGDDVLEGAVLAAGRLFAVGWTTSEGAGGADAVLVEIHRTSGQVLSQTLFGGTYDDRAYNVAALDNELYVVGDTRSFATAAGNALGESDVMLLRYAIGETAVPANQPPTANPGGPYVVAEGSALVLDGSLSSDPDQPADTLIYEWDLDYDGSTFVVHAVGMNPTVSFPDNFSARTIALRVTDAEGVSDLATTTLSVANVAPIAVLLSDPEVDEGSTGVVSFTDQFDPSPVDMAAGFLYSYDFDNDGTFEIVGSTDASAVVPAEFLADGPSVRTVRARIEDKDGGFTDYTVQIVVHNVPPTITHLIGSAPEVGDATEGQPVSIYAAFSDPGVFDTHTAVIDWGDGTITSGSVEQDAGFGSVAASHAYQAGGIYTVRLTVTDKDGAEAVSTTTLYVSGIGVHGGVLQVIGTRGDDHVTVNAQGNGQIRVHANFLPEPHRFRTFDLDGIDSILVVLGDGDDHATIAGNVRLPAIIDGGAGNDHLKAGGGPTVLIGGDGDDMLIGGSGRNILIGGTGADRLVGGPGEDILIAGWTAWDRNYAALAAISAEWNSARDFATRVRNLWDGTGSAERLNGDYFLRSAGPDGTVFDDDDQDHLTGGAGRDWFFFRRDEDLATDLVDDLFADDLEWLYP